MRAHWLVAVVVGCNLGVIACEPSEPVNVNKKDSGADVPQNTTGTGGSGTGGSGTGGAGTGGSGGDGSGGAGTGGSGGGTGGAGTGGSGGNPDAGSMDAPADSPVGNPDAAADQAPGDDVPPAGDAMPDMGMLDDAGFPIGATIGSCAPLNWTVSASASATADQPPNAIDGVLTTRWSTGAAQAAGMYYQIDFGGYVRLSQIKLDNTGSPGDHPRGFEVLASPDGIDFSTMVATGTPGDTAPADNLVTIDFDPRAIRFLRIGMTGASGSWWSIHELGVTCQIPDGNGGFTTDVVPDDLRCGPGTDGGVPDAGAGDPFNRALWTLSASSTSALPADIISHATDGDITTRWSNGVLQVPGQFFKVDMGAVGCIGQLRMVASALDFVAAYKVSVSVDDVKYIAVAKGVGANVLQIRVPPHLGRYVRIDQTGTANAWWSIDELTITP